MWPKQRVFTLQKLIDEHKGTLYFLQTQNCLLIKVKLKVKYSYLSPVIFSYISQLFIKYQWRKKKKCCFSLTTKQATLVIIKLVVYFKYILVVAILVEFLIISFYFSLEDRSLSYCVNLCCLTAWISYAYIHSLVSLPPTSRPHPCRSSRSRSWAPCATGSLPLVSVYQRVPPSPSSAAPIGLLSIPALQGGYQFHFSRFHILVEMFMKKIQYSKLNNSETRGDSGHWNRWRKTNAPILVVFFSSMSELVNFLLLFPLFIKWFWPPPSSLMYIVMAEVNLPCLEEQGFHRQGWATRGLLSWWRDAWESRGTVRELPKHCVWCPVQTHWQLYLSVISRDYLVIWQA